MIPLSLLKVGERSTIKKVGGREETRQFLEKLGFVSGSQIAVVAENHGNLIVNIKESRVALSKEMANKILT